MIKKLLKKLFPCSHVPVTELRVKDATIKEPSDPKERAIKIKIQTTTCQKCGQVLNIQPRGIVYDPKYSENS